MMQCCKTKTTPFCDECGADLEAKSLTGLKKYLQNNLQAARKRLAKWVNDDNDEEKAKQGIIRNTNTIIELDSWLAEVTNILGQTRNQPRLPELT